VKPPRTHPFDPPLPDTPDATILWYGGSFDPPTTAHRDLPEAARHAINASALVYCPAARSPHKPDPPIAPASDRLDMLAAAIEHNPRAHISTIELDRAAADPETPSYTADTLAAVQKHLTPGSTLRLLMGEDQARSFHRWKHPERIARLAEPVVMLRAQTDDAEAPPHARAETLANDLAAHWGPDSRAAWLARIVHTPHSTASSTRARQLLAAPTSPEHDAELATILPPAVLRIAKERRLYTRPS